LKCRKEWNGAVSSAIRRIRNSKKYFDWRLKVFERDKFVCQKCGVRSGYLHAHHRKPLVEIIEKLKIEYPLFDLFDIAMISKELWDIENGVTLCESCHREIHEEIERRKRGNGKTETDTIRERNETNYCPV
jgi:5-methylcytosine-specific restriction endonuclease McrA